MGKRGRSLKGRRGGKAPRSFHRHTNCRRCDKIGQGDQQRRGTINEIEGSNEKRFKRKRERKGTDQKQERRVSSTIEEKKA